jgi:hypothetical protein
MLAIRIREEVIVLSRVRVHLIMNCLKVFTWCRVLNCDTHLWPSVDILQQLVEIFEPHPRISISKVLTNCMKKI